MEKQSHVKANKKHQNSACVETTCFSLDRINNMHLLKLDRYIRCTSALCPKHWLQAEKCWGSWTW